MYPNSSLTVEDNTFVNDLNSAATAVRNVTSVVANVANNSFWNILPANITAGSASVTGTTILTTEPRLDYSPPHYFAFAREVPIETLSAGDRVATLSGEMKSIKWIGRGRIGVSPKDRSPNAAVIIGAGALSDGFRAGICT